MISCKYTSLDGQLSFYFLFGNLIFIEKTRQTYKLEGHTFTKQKRYCYNQNGKIQTPALNKTNKLSTRKHNKRNAPRQAEQTILISFLGNPSFLVNSPLWCIPPLSSLLLYLQHLIHRPPHESFMVGYGPIRPSINETGEK